MPASQYVNREHVGGAVDTTIVSDITGSSLAITITDATGWPTGGANGPFHVIMSYDIAGKEKAEVQSRTGNTLTIADTGKRGIDGTSATSHTAGAKIRHCFTAIDAQEANDHIANTGLDHHTQYLNSARHAAINHTAAMIGADEIGTSEIAPLAVTSAELAANSVIAGKIATGGISAAAQFASGVVDAAAIGTGAVGSSELGTDAVIAGKIADAAIDDQLLFSTDTQPIIVSGSDPGALGANKFWFDTTARQWKVRNAANSAWDIYSELIVPWTSYVPTLGGVTLGSGGTRFGRYTQMGKTVVGVAGFILGTSGANVTAGITVSLPVTAADVGGMTDRHHCGARAVDSSAGNVQYAGIGAIRPEVDPNIIVGIATAGTTGWAATVPIDWDNNDDFSCFFEYEAA